MTSFCGVPAAFRTCRTAFQCLSAWVHVEPNSLAFECTRLLLNVLKWLLRWIPKILRALLVFENSLPRVMLSVFHLKTFLAAQDFLRLSSQNHHFYIVQTTFGTFAQLEHVYHNLPPKYDDFRQQFSSYQCNEEELPAKTRSEAQSSTYLSKNKLLLFTLQMNDTYWKRHTMIVAFQRMFGILERWNNNQVTPSLSKPHQLSYTRGVSWSLSVFSIKETLNSQGNLKKILFKVLTIGF